jgi:hypothetical protein
VGDAAENQLELIVICRDRAFRVAKHETTRIQVPAETDPVCLVVLPVDAKVIHQATGVAKRNLGRHSSRARRHYNRYLGAGRTGKQIGLEGLDVKAVDRCAEPAGHCACRRRSGFDRLGGLSCGGR